MFIAVMQICNATWCGRRADRQSCPFRIVDQSVDERETQNRFTHQLSLFLSLSPSYIWYLQIFTAVVSENVMKIPPTQYQFRLSIGRGRFLLFFFGRRRSCALSRKLRMAHLIIVQQQRIQQDKLSVHCSFRTCFSVRLLRGGSGKGFPRHKRMQVPGTRVSNTVWFFY